MYREGKPLTDVIPPDRRRQRAILMIGGGMLAGALLLEGGRRLFSPPDPPVADAMDQREAVLSKRCFQPQTDLTKATVQVELDVDVDGNAINSHYEGSDARVTSCVEQTMRGWNFGRQETRHTMHWPLSFVR